MPGSRPSTRRSSGRSWTPLPVRCVAGTRSRWTRVRGWLTPRPGWMTAAEPALDVPAGFIARAFLDNQRDASSTRLSEDPVARTLMGFLDGEHEFTGTHTDLYAQLIRRLPSDVEAEDLPRNAQQLSRRLKQLAPALRLAGYRIKYPRRGRGGARIILLGDGRDTSDAS